MNCPNCGHTINPAAVLGAKGGRAKGAAKVRSVDYAALARKSHASRRANSAQKQTAKRRIAKAAIQKELDA